MEAYNSISAGSILGCSCAREINRQLTPQWRTPITVLKWIGHLCFSMVLSSALLTQRPVGGRIRDWERSGESSAIGSKSDRICVSVAKSSLGVRDEWDRWLLLYPKTGIPKIHAQSSASQWKIPLEHALRVASVLCNTGFFPVLVLFSHCTCVASFCMICWLHGGHFVTFLSVPWGSDSSIGEWSTSILRHSMLFLHNCS